MIQRFGGYQAIIRLKMIELVASIKDDLDYKDKKKILDEIDSLLRLLLEE